MSSAAPQPSPAPLRKVLRREPCPGLRALRYDRLACGHFVVVTRYARALPYWHCYVCALPRVDVAALSASESAIANDRTVAS